ncbi:34-kDa subunit of RNA polymerase III (C), partial [Ascosphaera pollenicola]
MPSSAQNRPDADSSSTFAGKLDLHAFKSPSSPSLSSHQDKGKSPVRNHHVTAAAAATAPLASTAAYSSPTTRAMKRRLMDDELQPPLHDDLLVTPSQQQQQPKAPRPSRKAAELPPAQPTTSNFRDTISPDMILLFVGVNPGIQTGITGHSYAHPSNLYWKLLHQSGITVHRHPPRDTYVLPELYNIGNTNLVVRPTRDASSLTRAEMDEGARLVQQKIAAARPEA